MKAYPTQVKVVWRDKPLPMHSDAPLAAEAAREAYAQKGNAGFAKIRKLMFDHQGQGGLKREALEGYAKEIGLDVAKFNAALDSHVHKAAIDADDKAGSDIGVNGTPSFIVGPYYISGAQPLTKFKKAVELALNPPPAAKAGVPGVTDPKSGLVVQDVTTGKGREVKAGDKITVHYVGTLPGRHGVRLFEEAKPAFRLLNRQRDGHQRMGARSHRHEGGRSPQADHPAGVGVRRSRFAAGHPAEGHLALRRGAHFDSVKVR